MILPSSWKNDWSSSGLMSIVELHRTGIAFGTGLDRLRQTIEQSENLDFAGLHVYDGHLHQPEIDQRRESALQIIQRVRQYLDQNPVPTIVGGGSPTFPFWAEETDWECSPGTPVFWDVGYANSYPDLPFRKAVALITRVISKPQVDGRSMLCLDLGYKSIASEMPLEFTRGDSRSRRCGVGRAQRRTSAG